MVGYTLRQERERQNLSIDDIEQGTSIRALYIEAIENGEYDKLPGAVYTKGFIKNYAKFLGMDADALAKEFANDIAEISEETTNTSDTEQSAEKKSVSKPVKPEKKRLGHSVQERNRSSSGLLVVAAVVLIAAMAGFAWSWLTNSEGDVATANPPKQQTQPIQQYQSDTTEPTTTDTDVANANPAQKSDGLTIQARFNNECWTLVTVDGAVVQEGIIDAGQTLSWEGKDDITFRFGNAGAVELFQDGKSLGVPGATGEIIDKTFTRK